LTPSRSSAERVLSDLFPSAGQQLHEKDSSLSRFASAITEIASTFTHREDAITSRYCLVSVSSSSAWFNAEDYAEYGGHNSVAHTIANSRANLNISAQTEHITRFITFLGTLIGIRV
jgi:hypothetical protein